MTPSLSLNFFLFVSCVCVSLVLSQCCQVCSPESAQSELGTPAKNSSDAPAVRKCLQKVHTATGWWG